MSAHLLFLDRDGTLNRTVNDRPPSSLDEVDLLPGVEPILSRYAAEGWQLVIVSNQGGVAHGSLTEEQAHAVQQRVIDLLPVPVAASYLCPHMPGALVPEYDLDCPNRKPKPGFLHSALQQFSARPEDCLFVGDAITDQQAAEAAGVPFHWADRFFGRSIRRGLLTRDGQWVNLRQAKGHDADTLLATIRQVTTGEGSEALRTVQRQLQAANVSPARGVADGQRDPGAVQLQPPAHEHAQLGEQRDLYLLAVMDDTLVGWLTLLREDALGGRRTADLTFGVDPAHRDLSIGSLLLDTGLEWASWQPELERICVDVPADNVPVNRLCCKFGFVEGARRQGNADADQITMICDR